MGTLKPRTSIQLRGGVPGIDLYHVAETIYRVCSHYVSARYAAGLFHSCTPKCSHKAATTHHICSQQQTWKCTDRFWKTAVLSERSSALLHVAAKE